MNDFKSELTKVMQELSIVQKLKCSDKEFEKFTAALDNEEELPNDVHHESTAAGYSFWRIGKTEMSPEEISQVIIFRQATYLKSIMKSMKFFVILAIVSIAANVIMLIRFLTFAL